MYTVDVEQGQYCSLGPIVLVSCTLVSSHFLNSPMVSGFPDIDTDIDFQLLIGFKARNCDSDHCAGHSSGFICLD